MIKRTVVSVSLSEKDHDLVTALGESFSIPHSAFIRTLIQYYRTGAHVDGLPPCPEAHRKPVKVSGSRLGSP